MGCLARLGCLFMLALLAAGAWITRGSWLPERYRVAPRTTTAWQPVSDAGAQRTERALEQLSETRGPVYQTLSAADVASLAFNEAAKRYPGAVDSVGARVEGNRLAMRARVAVAPFRDRLGPIVGMLHEREVVELSGSFQMIRPGLGAFDVQRASIGAVTLPQGMIPTLVREISGGARPKGLPDAALPLPVPPYVSDIRIANGKVTLYKNVK